MEQYPSYKDSGVEWIGEIPSHWHKLPIKWFGDVMLGKMLTPNQKPGYVFKPYLRSQNIQTSGVDVSDVREMWFSKNELIRLLLKDSDLLLNEGGDVGRTSIWKCELDECYFQNSVNRIRFRDDSQMYFFYLSTLFHSIGYYDSIVNRVSIPHLTKDKLESVVFLRPPLPEQHQIVSFLDNKIALIDKLIETKKRKIELLKEYRTSLINQVVTKGLNPNVQMKDSGVEWIGEIPSHWKEKRVKYLIESIGGIKIGPFGSSLKLDTLTEEGIKIYGQGNVIKNDFSLGHRHIPFERFESEFTQYEIIEGDILVTMMGTTGKSKVFKKEYKRGILDSHLLRLRFKNNHFISNLFVTILEESDYILHQIRISSKGSIMEGLNSSIVKELTVLTPPYNEQQQIVSYLDEKTSTIDKEIGMEERKIDLLKEYRQSMISEVVTGKIKVTSDE